jgi:exodeoxyribonuclease VII large subunit
MENTPQPELVLQVSDAIALFNQTLESAYPFIVVEGEVASFKVNQSKYVFFDIKDASGTLGCFMSLFQLRTQLEDGMRVRVVAQPKLTAWGKFSLTVRDVKPVGEGSLKRAFELLFAKLQKEGLFDESRKRTLPQIPKQIGVISSTQAAGYADFVKIVSERWGDVELVVAHTQVQGVSAPEQIMRALAYFNEMPEPVDVIALLRGGGSADDLAAFNDEPLVRAIATSRIPTVSGIGHEVDTTLVDLAVDVRAATPSNAAQLLVPDRHAVKRAVQDDVVHMVRAMDGVLTDITRTVTQSRSSILDAVETSLRTSEQAFARLYAVLHQLNPRTVLKRGYGLVLDEHSSVPRNPKVGDKLKVELEKIIMKVGVEHVEKKSSN